MGLHPPVGAVTFEAEGLPREGRSPRTSVRGSLTLPPPAVDPGTTEEPDEATAAHRTTSSEERGGAGGWLGGARFPGFFPWAFVAAGVLLRVARYWADNSLEVAESELALNIMHRGFTELLRPLDYDQGAPLGFLWIVKLLCDVFGPTERVLRLYPFVCGIAALLVFKVLAQRTLGRFASTVALGLFAVAPTLLWYSAQVKQYSSDVAISCILLLSAWEVHRRNVSRGSAIALALTGLSAILLSHPAVFTLAGAGIALAIPRLARGESSRMRRLAAVGAVWLASFAGLYFFFLRNLTANAYLQQYWSANVMPLPPHTYVEARWYVRAFFGLFLDPGGFELLTALAAFAFLIGLVTLWSEERSLLLILVLPIGFTLVASGLRQYPFGHRLILFLEPSLLLVMAAGADRLRTATRTSASFVSPLLLALLFVEPVASATRSLVSAKRYEDVRPAVRQLSDRWRPGDTLYLYFDAQYAFRYYAEREGIALDRVVVGTSSESRWSEDLSDLVKLRGKGRVWFLFSHVHQRGGLAAEDRFFLVHLDRIGKEVEKFEAADVSLYLYDLGI